MPCLYLFISFFLDHFFLFVAFIFIAFLFRRRIMVPARQRNFVSQFVRSEQSRLQLTASPSGSTRVKLQMMLPVAHLTPWIPTGLHSYGLVRVMWLYDTTASQQHCLEDGKIHIMYWLWQRTATCSQGDDSKPNLGNSCLFARSQREIKHWDSQVRILLGTWKKSRRV
jgi:hypothetical protein